MTTPASSESPGFFRSPTPVPLSIAPNCWLVGRRNPRSLLQCNTYVRVYDGEGGPLRVCIDPGSQLDFHVVDANIRRLVGDLAQIDAITLNHQDPDVVGNAPRFCALNPRLTLLASEESWRLVQHLAFQPGRLGLTSAQSSQPISLGRRRPLVPIPTPFCHFRGAVAFYDPEIRTLFSGDLLGGFNQLGRVHLFAEPGDWQGVAQFHQIYMPTRDALRYVVRQIRALRPAVEVIAPQHGYAICGDQVSEFLDKVSDLPVGGDLLTFELDEKHLQEYERLLRELAAWIGDVAGPSEAHARLASREPADDFEKFVKLEGADLRVVSHGYSALAKAFARLTHGEPPEFVNAARDFVIRRCGETGLPVPPIGLGLEERSP
jgi:serine/threonine-protein kinase